MAIGVGEPWGMEVSLPLPPATPLRGPFPRFVAECSDPALPLLQRQLLPSAQMDSGARGTWLEAESSLL